MKNLTPLLALLGFAYFTTSATAVTYIERPESSRVLADLNVNYEYRNYEVAEIDNLGNALAVFYAEPEAGDGVQFDTLGGTRAITSIDWYIQTDYNWFFTYLDTDYPLYEDTSSYSMTASINFTDMQGNSLLQVEETYHSGTADAGGGIGESTIEFLTNSNIRQRWSTDPLLINALLNEGLRVEVTDTHVYHLTDTQGNPIITGISTPDPTGWFAQNNGSNHYNLGLNVRYEAVPAPEPSSTMLIGLGGMVLVLRRKK